ncbi:hypothetical protein Ocin01_17216 [Orchesella cincta]|uniref:Uncharacterized protein n=1 Tax=Orchesella cincta TaxID=48709 RepID=A0A1D2M906_ORCCI|nr:hypothetical protein Ocin01_17216 [Orchesella cincta]
MPVVFNCICTSVSKSNVIQISILVFCAFSIPLKTMVNIKFSFVVVASTLMILSVDALKCWQCDGYDRVEYQCSPENNGRSVECTEPNPMCLLVEERYDDPSRPRYYTKKCVDGTELEGKSNTCDPPQAISRVKATHTHCYCNGGDNCNQWSIGSVNSKPQTTTGGKKNGADFHSINNFIIFITVCVSMFFLKKQ